MMKGFEATHLSNGFTVSVKPSSKVFSEPLRKQVDHIWDDAKKSQSWLFNGLLLSYLNFENNILFGEFVEYKYFFARTVDRSLQKELQVYPIGIMALTKWKDKLLIGRRSNTVTLYNGLYENVPTGSLDSQFIEDGSINLQKQCLQELEEEAKISNEKVKNIRPLFLIHDNNDFLVEIISEIELKDSASNQTDNSSDEYSTLQWMDRSEVALDLHQEKDKYVPVVHLIFDLYFDINTKT